MTFIAGDIVKNMSVHHLPVGAKVKMFQNKTEFPGVGEVVWRDMETQIYFDKFNMYICFRDQDWEKHPVEIEILEMPAPEPIASEDQLEHYSKLSKLMGHIEAARSLVQLEGIAGSARGSVDELLKDAGNEVYDYMKAYEKEMTK